MQLIADTASTNLKPNCQNRVRVTPFSASNLLFVERFMNLARWLRDAAHGDYSPLNSIDKAMTHK
jgi:hypothetical protein